MNPWHDIPAERITKDEFLVMIEIPRGSRKKYEIDKDTGLLFLDRILKTSNRFPANYGFIPRTLSEDGDPLDVLVVSMEEIHPLATVVCRPVGVLEMIDNGERDEKIIAVPLKDPNYCNIKDASELPAYISAEIEHFLRVYKDLEKDCTIELKPIQGKTAAVAIVAEAMELYKKTFKK